MTVVQSLWPTEYIVMYSLPKPDQSYVIEWNIATNVVT